MGCCGQSKPSSIGALSTQGVSMPLRQLKHKVGDKLFETKQAAVEYAATNGGVPQKVIVETDMMVQASKNDEPAEADLEITQAVSPEVAEVKVVEPTRKKKSSSKSSKR